jgi:hypothetical protein
MTRKALARRIAEPYLTSQQRREAPAPPQPEGLRGFWPGALLLQRLIIVPSSIAVIAVSISLTPIMVVAMVPVRISVIGVTSDIDSDVSGGLQIGACQESRNEQDERNYWREF